MTAPTPERTIAARFLLESLEATAPFAITAFDAREIPMRSIRGPKIVALIVPALAMLLLTGFGVLAQGTAPPPDAVPGSFGFKGTVLATVDTSVAPGYQLQLAETVFEPGAYVTSHFHPTAIVVCVQSGALGFALQHGSATVTWFTPAPMPAANDPLLPGTAMVQRQLLPGSEIVLQPRDCVSFDHFVAHTSHTGWNASDGSTVLIEARLVKSGEPYTVFIDALGTPVAP
jgi:hypothetical protein